MLKSSKFPAGMLMVIIRDDSPIIFCGDYSSYRSVDIELTDEQISALELKWVGQSGKIEYYETISRCFIEPE